MIEVLCVCYGSKVLLERNPVKSRVVGRNNVRFYDRFMPRIWLSWDMAVNERD